MVEWLRRMGSGEGTKQYEVCICTTRVSIDATMGIAMALRSGLVGKLDDCIANWASMYHYVHEKETIMV